MSKLGLIFIPSGPPMSENRANSWLRRLRELVQWHLRQPTSALRPHPHGPERPVLRSSFARYLHAPTLVFNTISDFILRLNIL